MPNIQDENVLILRAFLTKCLDKKVPKISEKLGCNICPELIQACHCVGRTTDTVIVKFFKQKDCQHIWSMKKDLKKLTMEDCELPGNNKLFYKQKLVLI